MPVISAPAPELLYGERIIDAGQTIDGIGRLVAGLVLDPPAKRPWWIAFGACVLLVACAAAFAHLEPGTGGATLDRASYQWWVGIAQGSLLLSAVLLLAGVEWRCSVSRISESVALLAAIAAGFCALIGRWGSAGNLYPPFGSPAAWDATGMACFIVVCASLWSIGMLPDLATLRNRAVALTRTGSKEGGTGQRPSLLPGWVYRLLAVGWRGSAVHWQRWVEAYRAIALLAALLVIALQTGASVMLAASTATGRHDTLLPVMFLVGAVQSGVGVTAALVVAIRAIDGLGALITKRHLDVLARLLLVLGLAGLYCHATEILSTLLYGDAFARAVVERGFSGDLAWAFWTVVVCGLLPVQVFWLPRARRSAVVIAQVGTLVAIGAYADQVMALAVTLQNDAATPPVPADAIDIRSIVAFAGSMALFFALLLLALRTLPIVSIAQTRQLVIDHNAPEAAHSGHSATSAAKDTAPARSGRIAAAFSSEKALAAATRALLGRDRTLRIDAFGPVPIPGAFEALRPIEHPIRRTALISALLGGFGFLALCLAAALWIAPPGTGARLSAAWSSFVLPSVSVALATGTLAILVTLLIRSHLPQRDPRSDGTLGFPYFRSGRFVLTVDIGDGPDNADRIEARLASLPDDDGRPLAIHRGAR